MTRSEGLSPRQAAVKRAMDLVVATLGLLVTAPVIAVAWVAATIDTRQNGLFRQSRVGMGGATFDVLKIRTMRGGAGTTVTTSYDVRITRLGALLRGLKIDELPQLVNVVRGEMSLVGPRPDVPGFADALTGADRIVLSVRPGITGPAALAFRHEESLLASVADPETYNREVILPEKVRINREYVQNWSLAGDLRCLLGTVSSVLEPSPSVGGTPRE
jgi:lipopolysaccharide/colanic/teichoic acid biosynthesis glycosyltransferase